MDGFEDSEDAGPVTMQQIRKRHQRKRREEYLMKILGAVMAPRSVCMEDIRGSDEEVASGMELFYPNGCL
jgi:hypothetical protein